MFFEMGFRTHSVTVHCHEFGINKTGRRFWRTDAMAH
jgi:hypothetical protein